MLYNSINILNKRPSGLSFIEKIRLIDEKVKGYASRYFKTIEESINPVFYAWVIIECVVVKVAEFRGVPL